MSTPRLAGKVSIITGAGQGIGLATALKFAREGATVICCDVKQNQVDDAAAQCRALGVPTLGLVVDVTQREMVDAMVQRVLTEHGRIDVLVNNAGITQDARLQKMTIEQFDKVIDVNLRGVFHCAQAVADTMVAQGSGVILNASSVVGVYGNFGQTNYAASKFGVIGFTKTWSRELGPKGVRINAVAPSLAMHPFLAKVTTEEMLAQLVKTEAYGRPAEVWEVANVMLFLASDLSSYMTGEIVPVSSQRA